MDSTSVGVDSDVGILQYPGTRIPGGFTPPPSPPPPACATTKINTPFILQQREREHDPAVIEKTFPVLNEAFGPRTLEPLSSVSNAEHSGVGSGDSEHHQVYNNVFTAANKPTKHQKLARLKDKTKEAIKSGVRFGNHNHNRDKLDDRRHDKSRGFVHRAAEMITHPSSVIKQKLTGAVVSQIAELNTPYDSNGAEAEFVAAHAKKEAAIESDDTAGVQDAARTIEELEIKMRNMKMGVIMGRHVNRVRVVPKLHRERPEKEEFLIRDENGMVLRDENGMEQVDYLTWLGQYLVYVTQDFTSQYIEDWAEDPEPLCIDRMRCHIERIFIASSSWQRWFLHIRDVYRWKDPNETFRWLALYIFLWSTSHVVAFVWGYLIFSTTKRYIFPQTIEDYREKVLRQRVRSLDALRFDQVLSSGSKGLISYFESEIGPQIQLQLGDIASLLEVANNFIEWQAPRATFFTLVFLSSCFIITLFGDMQLCMQLMFFVFGLIFFFSFPISSHYPKYRYLVSPFKWALWGVPNNAEWAFAELRFEAQNRRERMIAEHIDHDPDQWETDWEDHSDVDSFISAAEFGVSPLKEDEEIMRFRCRCGGHAGRLYISPARMRYETIRGKVLWKKDWRELTEVKKTKKKGIEKLVGGLSLGLELVFVPENGRDVIVKLDELGKRRDEAFCTILGFSGLKWQWCS